MVIVFVLAVLHQSTRFFDTYFSAAQFDWNGSVHWGCRFQSASWVIENLTENIYYTCYYTFRILFVHVIPCLALVILNLLLFRALKVAQKKREALFKDNRKSESRKLRDSNSTTIMLMVIVIVFLATEIPLAICTVLNVFENALLMKIVDVKTLNTTILFTNSLIMLSYPVNFAIYCGMSLQFRETFKDLFMKGYTSERKANASNFEATTRFSVVNGPRPSTIETNL